MSGWAQRYAEEAEERERLARVNAAFVYHWRAALHSAKDAGGYESCNWLLERAEAVLDELYARMEREAR